MNVDMVLDLISSCQFHLWCLLLVSLASSLDSAHCCCPVDVLTRKSLSWSSHCAINSILDEREGGREREQEGGRGEREKEGQREGERRGRAKHYNYRATQTAGQHLQAL